MVDLYVAAGERLEAAGIAQYEISNFARPGFGSRHNLKYWTRQPYLGYGVDAHSMLRAKPNTDPEGGLEAVRWSTPDQLERYVAGDPGTRMEVTPQAALEESFFLGLRLNAGVRLRELEQSFGVDAVQALESVMTQTVADGLLERRADSLRLTSRGRLLSNEVFERFLAVEPLPIR
jgi:oxygen-independent coproporphyrinogen-3 oxidase